MHVPVFALLAVLVFHLAGAATGKTRTTPWPWLGVALLVPLVEAGQALTGREASVRDVLYGWAGCLIGGLIILGRSRRGFGRFGPFMAAILLLAGVLVYPAWIAFDQVARQRMFPVLSRFDAFLERSRWRIASCDVEALGEGWRVTIRDDIPFPRLFLRDFPRDWSGLRRLCLDIEPEGDKPLDLWVRVDDQPDNPPYGERFQIVCRLQPGANQIRLPRSTVEVASGGRTMNLASIHEFGLFFHREDAGRRLKLHRIYLELERDVDQ